MFTKQSFLLKFSPERSLEHTSNVPSATNTITEYLHYQLEFAGQITPTNASTCGKYPRENLAKATINKPASAAAVINHTLPIPEAGVAAVKQETLPAAGEARLSSCRRPRPRGRTTPN